MAAKILWIESGSANSVWIPALRQKHFVVESVATGKAALACIPNFRPQIVIVNAASLRSNGTRICQTVHHANPHLPIILISHPEFPVKPELTVANFVISQPFTARKLVNRITALLPKVGANTLKVGNITLDVEHNIVCSDGVESRLTPRLTQLLKYFLEAPGTVLDREQIFTAVWETEYTADTRTLDVHVSWLRRAIEADPLNPQLLKTIRGVGYRLDVNGHSP